MGTDKKVMTKLLPSQGIRKSLSGKILFGVLFISSCVTFFITAGQLLFDYRQDLSVIEKTFAQIQTSYVDTFVHSLWDLNDQALKTQVTGLLKLPDVKYIEIRDAQREVLAMGEKQTGRVKKATFDLLYTGSDHSHKLGTMTVTISLESVVARLYEKIAIVFLSQFLKTILVSFLILILIRKTIIQPLMRIVEYLKSLELKEETDDLILSRAPTSHDELDTLAKVINQMKRNLKSAYLQLNQHNLTLEQKVKDRTVELERAQSLALESARQAGMAEIATGVLHNVGNILNSVNIGSETIQRISRGELLESFLKVNTLVQENKSKWGDFFISDPKGSKIFNLYNQLENVLSSDFKILQSESIGLQKNIQLIKDVVNLQQSFAKGVEFKEEVFLHEVVESALAMQVISLTRHDITIIKKLSKIGPILAQKAKLIHVLLNLFKNAKEAMNENKNGKKILSVEIGVHPGTGVFIKVADTGIGISRENLNNIFNHGYTTKKTGHGFGLHSCANSLTEMGGCISVHSDGNGQGTAFTIQFSTAETQKNKAS